MGLTRFETAQVKQELGECITDKDILVAEGEFQNILGIRAGGRWRLRQDGGKQCPERVSLPPQPSPGQLTFTAPWSW